MRYRTEQRELLLSYFAEHASEQFTVRALASALSPAIGESTVYRLVGELTRAGTVRRFQLVGSRGVAYQYIGGERCESHLHMRCTECQRICHLAPALSDFLQRQILASCRFRLDERATTLFGVCHACEQKRQREKGREESQ